MLCLSRADSWFHTRAAFSWYRYLTPDTYTLAIGLTFFQNTATYDVQFNLLMAASALIVLPVIVLFLLFQKSFISGISIGSIK